MPAVVVAAIVVIGVLILRQARASGLIRSREGRCDHCGAHAPVEDVRFIKNTGMILMFRVDTVSGTVCRRCASDLFVRTMLHTMTLGWWGLISFFANLLFIANNVAIFVWTQTLPSGAAASKSELDGQREYALNLLATKDRDTVVEVLTRATGASPGEVTRFLDRLGSSEGDATSPASPRSP